MDSLLSLAPFLVQLVNLAIVVFVLKKFLFTPYLAYIDEQERIRASIELQSRDAQMILENAKAEADKLRHEAQKDGEQIRAQSKSLAQNDAQGILQAAEQQATSIKTRAEMELQGEKAALERELAQRVIDVAIDLNRRTFGEQGSHQDLIRNLAPKISL